MPLQHWPVLQVALKEAVGGRGEGRGGGRETRRRTGDDVNMKEKVEGVGVSVFEGPGDKSFHLFGSSREVLLDFAFWWADFSLCVV